MTNNIPTRGTTVTRRRRTCTLCIYLFQWKGVKKKKPSYTGQIPRNSWASERILSYCISRRSDTAPGYDRKPARIIRIYRLLSVGTPDYEYLRGRKVPSDVGLPTMPHKDGLFAFLFGNQLPCWGVVEGGTIHVAFSEGV